MVEIIDAALCILEKNSAECNLIIKKSLCRFCSLIKKNYLLKHGIIPFEPRLDAVMRVGFICTYSPNYPQCLECEEIVERRNEYPKHERQFIGQLEEAMAIMPIESCNDYHHLVEAFDMMRHWLHIGECKNGLSLLVDHMWRLRGTPELRRKAQEVFNRLADDKTESVEDVKKLRREVERW